MNTDEHFAYVEWEKKFYPFFWEKTFETFQTISASKGLKSLKI